MSVGRKTLLGMLKECCRFFVLQSNICQKQVLYYIKENAKQNVKCGGKVKYAGHAWEVMRTYMDINQPLKVGNRWYGYELTVIILVISSFSFNCSSLSCQQFEY